MEILTQILDNTTLLAAILAWCIAQAIKFCLTLLGKKELSLGRLYGAGGMPSSHSALVMAMSTCIGRIYGFDSPIFAISCLVSLVVMYDAAGVRRATGIHARILNELLGQRDSTQEEHLKEMLGHTPLQVICGGVLGIVVGYFFST